MAGRILGRAGVASPRHSKKATAQLHPRLTMPLARMIPKNPPVGGRKKQTPRHSSSCYSRHGLHPTVPSCCRCKHHGNVEANSATRACSSRMKGSEQYKCIVPARSCHALKKRGSACHHALLVVVAVAGTAARSAEKCMGCQVT